jgi:hypothetical protein
VTTLLRNAQWLEAQQAEFAARTGAALVFWPQLQSAINELLEAEPAKGRLKVYASDDEPYLLTISAGLFDLKLACDVFSDLVFYSFTSAALKKLIPRESAIYYQGHLNLTRGNWGVVDSPGQGVSKIFADDPQTVEGFPLADRFAQWCVEQLMGGYTRITALEEAADAAAKAKEKAAKKEANNGGRNAGE